MDFLPDIAAARLAVQDFMIDHGATLPADVREKLRTLSTSPSPVDQLVGTAEFLYARSDDVGAAGQILSAKLAAFCATNGWHGLADGNRGGMMAQALMRDAGVAIGAPQDPKNDPAPKAEYLPEPKADDAADAPSGTPPAPDAAL